MLRRDGPETLKPLGEIEFASGIAAMFASGHYANALGCEAIIGGLSLLAGTRCSLPLSARDSVIRRAAAWDAQSVGPHPDPRVTSSPVTPPAGSGAERSVPPGRSLSREACIVARCMGLPHAAGGDCRSGAEIPTLQIVIDHCGGPVGVGPCSERDPDMFQQWRNGMRRLAELPNVCVKISGFGMTVRGFTSQRQRRRRIRKCWHRHGCRGLRPLFLFFGAERCMFASNFPVDKGMFSYGVFWNACKRPAQQASPDEQAQLFWRTAASCYRLTSVENINDQ